MLGPSLSQSQWHGIHGIHGMHWGGSPGNAAEGWFGATDVWPKDTGAKVCRLPQGWDLDPWRSLLPVIKTYQNTSLSEIHKLKQVETYKTMVLEWRLGWTWCIFAAFAGLGLARRWPGAAAASRCHKPCESSLHATGGDAVSPGLLQRWLHFWGRGKSWDLPDREGLTCMHSYARVLFLLFGGIGGIVNVQEPWPCFCQHGPKRWYWCVKMWSMQETYMISLQNLSWFRLFYGGWVLTNDSMGPGELVSMSDMYGFGRRFFGFAVCEVGLSFCILFSTNVWLGNSFHTCHRKKCLPIICRD